MKRVLVENDIFRLSRNKQVFEIEFVRPSNRVLVDSLVQTRLIENVTLSEDYRTLQFKAFSVRTFLDCELERSIGSLQMLSSLTTQLSYLIDHGHVFIGYNTKNIIVINDSVFVFLDGDLLTETVVGEGLGIRYRYPFSVRDFYFSPELLKITEIPSLVSYKTAYFSLGFLLLVWFSSKKGKCEDKGKDNDLYKEYLRVDDPCSFIKKRLDSSIPKSKLYWLLERSLVEDPLDRSLLFL
jgi:hypothetical protein